MCLINLILLRNIKIYKHVGHAYSIECIYNMLEKYHILISNVKKQLFLQGNVIFVINYVSNTCILEHRLLFAYQMLTVLQPLYFVVYFSIYILTILLYLILIVWFILYYLLFGFVVAIRDDFSCI